MEIKTAAEAGKRNGVNLEYTLLPSFCERLTLYHHYNTIIERDTITEGEICPKKGVNLVYFGKQCNAMAE